MNKLDARQFQPVQSGVLVASTAETPVRLNWRPSCWLIKVSLTAGYVLVHPSSRNSTYHVKVDNGTVRLPVDSQEIMIETVGATGWWSVYALRHMECFGVVGNGLLAAAGFSPLDLPSLVAWFDASVGMFQDSAGTTPAVADGDPIGRWSDQSGQGNHAVQATSANKPTLKLGVNGINGRAVGSFDGGDSIATPAFGAALVQPNTIYAVFAFGTLVVSLLFDGIVAGNRHLLFNSTGNPGKYTIGTGTDLSEAGTTLDTSPHVLAALFNTATSQFWIDNTSKASGNAGAGTLTGITLGARYDASANMTGKIAELLIYDVAHDATQRGNVQTYLASKYGITLS